MVQKNNTHVMRLHRYLPFSPAHDQIYEEYQKTEDSLNLKTVALEYLIESIQSGARVVILTGDAGHGKTHLCRRLLEEYLGYQQDQARDLIRSECDGSNKLSHVNDATVKPLRVFKDFSELAVAEAIQRLEEVSIADDQIGVICANEGRLRAILESQESGAGCKKIREEFYHSFDSGLASRDGSIHIINLNYQSVASHLDDSLLSRALREWLSGTRWRTCVDCDSNDGCPVYHNRNMLSQQTNSFGKIRQEKLEAIFATVERLRNVVTIREMLMTIAYILTGGLTCEDIHRKCRGRRRGWQHQYAYYNLLFKAPKGISANQLSQIPVLEKIAMLDPGVRASRDIDERLINAHNVFKKGQMDIEFEFNLGNMGKRIVDAAVGIDEIIGNPRSRADRKKEADFTCLIVRSLRRRAFFDEDLKHGTVMNRLGFKHGDDFLSILNHQALGKNMTRIKGHIIAGLHTIQGLQLTGNQTNFYMVDPAFGNSKSHAAIMAGKVTTSKIKLFPMMDKWKLSATFEHWAVAKSVDWIDRYIVLRIENIADSGYTDLSLDLMMYDCISRAGFGYVAEEFFAHDLRRIASFMGMLAERLSNDDSELQLFIHGKMLSVSIDDGVIQVA